VPIEIDRDMVQRLVAEGAQLVDVLPAEVHADAYLPQAINLPLKVLDRRTAGRLERARPVIVYCHDAE
jgi:rhodanese-related sulfurtransferase